MPEPSASLLRIARIACGTTDLTETLCLICRELARRLMGADPRVAKILQAAERIRDIVDRMTRITRVEMLQHPSSRLPPMLDIKTSSGGGPKGSA